MLVPGPESIQSFPPLPNSTKSTLSGDTWQIPNVAAYFSDNFRKFATNYYKQSLQNQTMLPFAPLVLNYPPEFAFVAIKDQTHSTYLEEYVYPLRYSLFVNGLEPFLENGRPRWKGAFPFDIGDQMYSTKVTLRYYPSSVWVRIVVWAGIIFSIWLLGKLGKKVTSG